MKYHMAHLTYLSTFCISIRFVVAGCQRRAAAYGNLVIKRPFRHQQDISNTSNPLRVFRFSFTRPHLPPGPASTWVSVRAPPQPHLPPCFVSSKLTQIWPRNSILEQLDSNFIRPSTIFGNYVSKTITVRKQQSKNERREYRAQRERVN